MTQPALNESAFLVLTALAAEPRHGYAVIQEVRRLSDGHVRLATGSLYATLDRLRTAGLIEVDREEVVRSRLRRYYRLTGAGAERLGAETERLRRRANAAAAQLRRLATGGGTA